MSSKYYAVSNGRKIGIFNSWDEAKPLVDKFKGAKYKSFKTLNEAQNYMSGYEPNPLYTPTNIPTITNPTTNNSINTTRLITYTDGSCIDKIGGYGFVLINNTVNEQYEVPVCGKVPYFPATNQIAELYAIYSVMYYLIQVYKTEIISRGLIIYTDSQYSIGCLTEWHYNWSKNGWINAKGESVANKELIQAILSMMVGLDVKFQHVYAHKGDKYNEWADRLANEGRMLK